MSAPAIVLRAVRRHGPVGLARIAVEEVRLRVWLKEQHVWYQLDLPAPGAAPWDDGDGLCLVHPSAGVDLNPFADLPSLGRTPRSGSDRGRRTAHDGP